MKKFLALIFAIVFVYISYTGLLFYFAPEQYLKNVGNIRILDKKGEILTDMSLPGGYSTHYTGSLDNALVRGIISIEDGRYYEHSGIDIIGKIGAIRENYNAGTIVRGGSTLTEQYIKNIYFPGEKRTIQQKIREAFSATILGFKYNKEQILRKYLDSVYMGNGLYGIQSAIDVYFGGENPDTLTETEIVEIITRIHSPNIGTDGKNYAEKVSQKLYGKSFSGELTRTERKIGINTFSHLTTRIQKEIASYCQGRENNLKMFVQQIPEKICLANSLDIQTTIDKNLSLFTRNTLEGIVQSLDHENVHNGAIYILNPKDNIILTYIGNRTNLSKENAIDMIQERRSVGSVLKPFIYNLAIAGGADGESLIMDDTKVYNTEQEDKSFVPENYVPKSYGPVRLKEALGNSLNSASVRLSESIGIGKIYDTYKKSGLKLDHDAGYYGYGIALGSVELTLENVVEGYTSLLSLNDGSHFLLYNILSDGKNRAKTFGISSILNTSIPIAVKTGTSTDFHDNWTIGYHPDAIIGVWVGNADQSPMQDVSGVSGAGPIFHHIAEYMIANGMIENRELTIPEGIEKTTICLDNSCMRKEEGFRWKNMTNLSRILEKRFYKSEFITPLTDEEIEKWKIR
ncbi:MAG: transglycosylase domain-containing protein [Candidatus Gracilibacteria bacterium]|nr:transglycosylase domain-containing protein [Candidatus Gracilibacteria bacterium]